MEQSGGEQEGVYSCIANHFKVSAIQEVQGKHQGSAIN